MLRIPAFVLLFAATSAVLLVATSTSSCTITTVTGEGEGEGEGEGGVGEGEGEGSEGEGEGGGVEVCGDSVDNDADGFTDCDDFDCIGDPACDAGEVSIQDFMDPNGVVKKNHGVTVSHAVVTGTHTASSGNVTLYVQAADGDTGSTANPYPQFAGTEVFVPAANVATFTDLSTIAIGDCVTFSGAVDLFGKQIQVSNVTNIAKTGGCGAAPAPAAVNASDVNDTGANSKKFLDTLVVISDATVTLASSGNNGSFEVQDAGGGQIFINGFLLATKPTAAVDDHFTSITGVLTEFDDNTNDLVHFDIDPRLDSDLAQ